MQGLAARAYAEDQRLSPRNPSRREWLRQAGLLGAAAPLGVLPGFAIAAGQELSPLKLLAREPITGLPQKLFSFDPSLYRFTDDEDAFLDEVQQRSFLYFWEQANPKTGQIEDRGSADGGPLRNASSVAATGFGLTALCIGAHHGWEEDEAVRNRVKTTLRFALKSVQQQHGFLYHFVHAETGQRILNSEVSPIDTCLFLCGALTCKAFFNDQEIPGQLSLQFRELASRISAGFDPKLNESGYGTQGSEFSLMLTQKGNRRLLVTLFVQAAHFLKEIECFRIVREQ